MQRNGQSHSVTLAALLALGAGQARAQTLTTLYTFTGGADGGNPIGGLLAGPNGSFYGTTTQNAGTIFQLSPPSHGQTAWTLTTLYTFSGGADGVFPEYLVTDKSGALYGMADQGGLFNGTCAYGGIDYGCGTVFKLSPPASGGTQWILTTLWSFTGGADGSSPTGGVVFGPGGALYGFTYGSYTCGLGSCGEVYKLTPPAPGGTAWSETTLYNFKGGRDGAQAGSYGLPVLDRNGRIYGTTGSGGNITAANCAPYGCGTVFQLTPPAPGATAWTKQTLLSFDGYDGFGPIGGLTLDAAGNLFGGTNEGGNLSACVPGSPYPNGCGVAFELSPPDHPWAGWSSHVVWRFANGTDGDYPFDTPLAKGGALYMTTSGNPPSYGSIDLLTPPGAADTGWREQTKFVFSNDADSAGPTGTLIARGGVMYGTTLGVGSGPAPYGTVYALKP